MAVVDDDKKKKKTSSNVDKEYVESAKKANKKILDAKKRAELEIQEELAKNQEKIDNELSNKKRKRELSTAQKVLRETAKVLDDVGSQFAGKIASGADGFLSSYSEYFSSINTNLIGSGKQYNNMLSTIQKAVVGNRSVTVVGVLNRLNDLVSKGIAYNVEQRAFLSTVSEKIATTFDATNGTLLQLVRLNRTDSTAAYLGMESALTEYLNGQFLDTSYLHDNLNETVSAALYEATSQLGVQEGAAFEYAVQKWLGSFYSAGMNQETISKLAQGIGYLGSGNVSALTGNTELNNMMAMASNYAGLDYSKLLTVGLDSNSVNKLLQGIYKQGRVMLESGDQVAKSQYAQLFGMTISDLTSLLNISTKDLESISSNMLSYSGMIAKTEYELSQVSSRTSVKEAVENSVANIMASIGENVANNAGLYTTYLLTKDISIPIPTPFVGTIDIAKVANSAIMAFSTMAAAGDVLAAIAGNKTLTLSDFTESNIQSFGRGLVSGVSSAGFVSSGSGSISYVGSGDKGSLIDSTLTDTSSDSKAVASSVGADYQYTIDDIYTCLADNIAVKLQNIIDNTYNISTYASSLDNKVTAGGLE